MHIMHVIDSLWLGGAERVLVDLANQTRESGLTVSVCLTRSGGDMSQSLDPAIPLFSLNRRRKLDWATFGRFSRILRQQGVDVLHAHSRSTVSFLIAAKVMGRVRQPIVMHDHFGGIEQSTSPPWWLRRFGGGCVSRYVGPSEKFAQCAALAGLSQQRVSVIDHGLDLNRIARTQPVNLRGRLSVSSRTKLGICVAGVRPEKGIDVLLQAIDKCPAKRNLRILIVGGARNRPYWNECQAMVQRLGLEGIVLFLGERQDIPRLLRSVDFAVHPAVTEAGPLVLIEYMAAGLPFVVAAVGGVAHRAQELRVEQFVPPNDAGALAEGLGNLLELSPRKRRARVDLAGAIARKHFDIRSQMSEWKRLYAAALKEVS